MEKPDTSSAATTESRLESPHPEYRSGPAELLGREGMVTVWDDLGRYVGCMGVELWRHLLTGGGDMTAAKLCNARVAGAQGGFCRNEAVAGRDYCEVHDDPQPRLRCPNGDDDADS